MPELRAPPILFSLAVFALACETPPETIKFDHSEGTAKNLSDCVCEYYDGTDNDWSLEITCTSGNSTLSSISIFADPRNINGEGDASTILIPTTQPANYRGGAAATISAIGENNHATDQRVIRDMANVAIRWDEQDDCNVDQPCDIDKFHLLPGSLSGGHGACEDYYATQRLILGQ